MTAATVDATPTGVQGTSMKDLFKRRFGVRHLAIGMVHTPALPGAPRYDRAGGMAPIVERAKADAATLVAAGFPAVMFCNEADMPYETRARAETIAALTRVVAEVGRDLPVPFGVNLLIDPAASVAIAHATGGAFVRAFLTGGFVGDMGVLATDGAGVQRLRAGIGADDVLVLANVTAGFSVPLADRPLAEAARGAVFIGLADAVVVGATAVGVAVDAGPLETVARAVPDTPVVVGTGAAPENVQALARLADGFIVGTAIKVGRDTLGPVDAERARAFMAALPQLEA